MKKSGSQSGSAHLIIIILIVLVVLGGLGYVVYRNFIAPKTTTNQNGNSDGSSDNAVNEASSVTSFYSRTYGFRLKYPKELYDVTNAANDGAAHSRTDGIIVAFDKDKNYTNAGSYAPLILVNFVKSELSPKQYANSLTVGDVSDNGQVIVNGVTGYKEQRKHMNVVYHNVYFSDGKSTIISLRLYGDSSAYAQAFTDMYNSFVLTN